MFDFAFWKLLKRVCLTFPLIMSDKSKTKCWLLCLGFGKVACTFLIFVTLVLKEMCCQRVLLSEDLFLMMFLKFFTYGLVTHSPVGLSVGLPLKNLLKTLGANSQQRLVIPTQNPGLLRCFFFSFKKICCKHEQFSLIFLKTYELLHM